MARWLTSRIGPLPRWLVVYVCLGAGAVLLSRYATGEVGGWSLYLLVSATPELVASLRRYLAEHQRQEAIEPAASGSFARGQLEESARIVVRQVTSRLRALERGDEDE